MELGSTKNHNSDEGVWKIPLGDKQSTFKNS